MRITFLGTGTSQGIPVIGSTHPVCLSNDLRDKRLRSSVFVEVNGVHIVIDCGPDFRQQMLREKPTYINGLIFTHEHSDHTAGLDDVRPFYFKQGEFNIYTDKNVLASLKQRFSYIFQSENKYPGAPTLAINPISRDTDFYVKNVKVTPIEVLHGQLPILGFRIQDFAYITDLKTIHNDEKLKLKNLDVLIVNALREEEHHSHMSLSEALAFIKTVNPKRAYLTHISHVLGFHEEVAKSLPKNVFLAYDQLTIKS